MSQYDGSDERFVCVFLEDGASMQQQPRAFRYNLAEKFMMYGEKQPGANGSTV